MILMKMREWEKVVCPAKACTDIKYGNGVVENRCRYSDSNLLTMYISSLAQHNFYILSWVQRALKDFSSELVLHTRKATGLFYVLVLFSGYSMFVFHFYLLD